MPEAEVLEWVCARRGEFEFDAAGVFRRHGDHHWPFDPIDPEDLDERSRAFDSSISAHRAITSCLEDLRSVDLAVTFSEANNNARTGLNTSDDGRATSHRSAASRSPMSNQRNR